MNRFVLPLLAMAFASPVSAQSSAFGSGTVSDWAGGHYGIQVGFPSSSTITFGDLPDFGDQLEGMSGGGQIGYRRQNDAFVYGAEIEFLVGEQALTAPGASDVDVRTTRTRLGGQAGYAFGRVLPYGTAGIARMTFQNTEGFGDTSSFGTFGGLGVEVQTGEHTSIAIEAVRESFLNFNEGATINVTQTTISAQLNLHF